MRPKLYRYFTSFPPASAFTGADEEPVSLAVPPVSPFPEHLGGKMAATKELARVCATVGGGWNTRILEAYLRTPGLKQAKSFHRQLSPADRLSRVRQAHAKLTELTMVSR